MKKKISLLSLLMMLFCLASCVNFVDDFSVDYGDRSGDDFEDTPEAYILSASTKAASTLPGYGQASNPFLIRNAAELKYFAEATNDGTLHPYAIDPEDENDLLRQESGDVHVKLMHDIQVDERYDWIPIGTFAHPVKGSFKGEDHTISGVLKQDLNITMERDTTGNFNRGSFLAKYGFFGYTGGCEVENLTVAADIIPNRLVSYSSVGGITAIAGGGKFTNCTFSGTIENVPHASMQEFYVGSLCGIGERTEVEGFKSEGTFRLNKFSSVANKKTFTAKECCIGGIVGFGIAPVYANCENKTDIVLENFTTTQASIGGIVGRVRYESDPYTMVSITNCGKISVTNVRHYAADMQFPGVYVGGILGYGFLRHEVGKTLNTGDITVQCTTLPTYVGGICGNVQIVRSENIDLYNAGNVTNNSTSGYTAGCFGVYYGDAFGATNSGNITSTCEFCDSVPESGATGGIVGRGYTQGCAVLSYLRNEGNITTPEPLETIHGKQSYAGSIVGSAAHTNPRTCMNSGKVNGVLTDDPDISMVGALWLGWERLRYGDEDYQQSSEGQYWEALIRQFITYGN